MQDRMRRSLARGITPCLAIFVVSILVVSLMPVGALAVTEIDSSIQLNHFYRAGAEQSGRVADFLDSDRRHDERSIMVRLRPGVTPDQVFREAHGAVFDDWWEVEVTPPGVPAVAAEAMARRQGVDLVDLNYQLHRFDEGVNGVVSAPNDKFFDLQWNFPAIQLPQAWDRSGGSGAVVGVLDTGIVPASKSIDLKCHTYVYEYNADTDTAGVGSASDSHGHGTHVSGTVAQCTDNEVGVAGVARDARIIPVNVFGKNDSASSSALARGIVWATNRGAAVINMSLGARCPAPCHMPVVTDAIAYAAAGDVVIVAASGNYKSNETTEIQFPANHPEVMAVGATDFLDQRAPYSSYGDGLDLVAPGGNLNADHNKDGYPDGIFQETLTSACPNAPSGPLTVFCFWQGTSMAAPHVAGAVALLRAAAPGATRIQVREALQQSGKDLGAAGYDPQYGYGLLQVDDAIAYLQLEVAKVSDTEPPDWSAQSFVTAVDVFKTRALVHWSLTASDTAGLSSFLVYAGRVDGIDSLIAEVAPDVDRLELTGLLAATEYGVRVEVKDTAGNVSQDGPVTTFLTAPDYVDTDSHLFEEDIEWLAGARVTRGCNPPVNDRFCPDDPVTRGQMAAFLGRALGLPATVEDYFDDVAQSVFEADINALAAAAVTRGCNPPVNNLYCPEQAVTRDQMASFLVRALQLEATGADTFVDIEGSVHANDIETLASSGITRGCNPPVNDLFCPDDTVTRGQMAAFLRRALGGN